MRISTFLKNDFEYEVLLISIVKFIFNYMKQASSWLSLL